MRKTMQRFACLLALLLLAACAPANTQTALQETPHPMSTTPQPISFDSYEEIAGFLKNGRIEDVSHGIESFEIAYQAMIDTFTKDGFFYEIHAPQGGESRFLSLYPAVDIQELGVVSWIYVDEKAYQCCVFCTKDAYILDEENALQTYWAWRGLSSERDDTRTAACGKEILRTKYNITRNVLLTPIDETHYLSIRSDESYEAVFAFMQEISLTRHPLN